jgi:hypothetical protein
MLKSILVSSAMVLLAAGSSMAQGMKADIPFNFAIGSSAKLPAGEYTVDTKSTPGLISLRSTEGKGGAHVISYGVTEKSQNKADRLVFHKYGSNTYFLSQVWVAGSVGREIKKSRREVEAMTAAAQPPETLVLFARK